MDNTNIITGDHMLVNSDSIDTAPEAQHTKSYIDDHSFVRINISIRKKADQVSLDDFALFRKLVDLAGSSGFEMSEANISKNNW